MLNLLMSLKRRVQSSVRALRLVEAVHTVGGHRQAPLLHKWGPQGSRVDQFRPRRRPHHCHHHQDSKPRRDRYRHTSAGKVEAQQDIQHLSLFSRVFL